MKNQNYVTILVHEPVKGFTYFEQIRGREMKKHIEAEIDLIRKRYKQLIKEIKK